MSDKPLGPFTYQKRNPILSGTGGMIRGPGHGCLVEGPKKTLWAFYTLTVCSEHVFERRVGVDPAGFDAEGNLFVKGPSEIPQQVPGERADPEKGNGAGWLPLTQNKAVEASSEREGREAEYAVDGYLRTWWQPAEGDTAPRLVVYLNGSFEMNALRLQWKERGLHYDNGVVPGPVKYLVEGLVDESADKWVTLVDATSNGDDLLIDYRAFPTVTGSRVRLLITGHAPGIQPGVMDFTVFGKATRFGYGPA